MPTIAYEGASYPAAPGEAVLDTLLRHGVSIPNSCRAGVCQSCLVRAVRGEIPPEAQAGLSPAAAQQGYFLSCICRPSGDLELEPAGGLESAVEIERLELLSATVLRVLLRPERTLDYRAGQYITLCRPDGLARSYSLASLPVEESLELHVRRAPQGRMSGWLFDEARTGDRLSIRGPAGKCFYTEGNAAQPILLAGTGTGLAPLIGICRDALDRGHHGPMHLYHGALRPEGLYLQDVLRELAGRYGNFFYHPVALEAHDTPGVRSGALDKTITGDHSQLDGWRGFVCGDPGIVRLLQKKLFLAGMASREISADAFLEAPQG